MRKIPTLFLILALSLCFNSTYIQAVESSSDKNLNIADFGLPEELGKIDSRFVGSAQTSDRWIILIQDIHGHLTAQENISAIVDHLNQVYGIDTFGIEGGWSKTKLSRSRQIPNSRPKQQLARALLEEEYITGPFYSALFNEHPLKLIGIEDKDLYLKNREVFLLQIDSREDSLKKISAAETELNALKKEIYHPELLNFDLALSAFREGSKAESFMPSLIPTAELLGADLSDLEQIQVFKEILNLEKNLNRKKLSSEAKRLVAASPNPRLNFEEILRSGQTPPEKLSHYPETLKFQEILKLQDTLSHHAFFSQIETTIDRVKEKLFQNDAEKELDAKAERFGLIKKLITLQAVPEDFKKSSAQKDLIREQASAADLSKELESGVEFYKLAQKRDAEFFEQITKQPLLAGNIGVVAGGFHTEGLTARLEKQGISYMIITPSLGENAEAPNEELYFKRMREGAALVPAQTLSHLANWPLKFLNRSFPWGVKTITETNDLSKAVQTVIHFRSPTKQAVASGNAISIENFMSLKPEEQKAIVETWLTISKQPGTKKIIAGYRTQVMKEILETLEGTVAFGQFIAPDKKMALAELRGEDDDYLLMESNQSVRRISITEGENPEEVLIKKFERGNEKPLIALIDPNNKSKKVQVFPAHWASFSLIRPLLTGHLSGNITPEFLERVSSLIREIFEAQGLLAKSA